MPKYNIDIVTHIANYEYYFSLHYNTARLFLNNKYYCYYTTEKTEKIQLSSIFINTNNNVL